MKREEVVVTSVDLESIIVAPHHRHHEDLDVVFPSCYCALERMHILQPHVMLRGTLPFLVAGHDCRDDVWSTFGSKGSLLHVAVRITND